MKFTPLSIPDVIQIEPQVFQDDRGFFMETYRQEDYFRAGIRGNFGQHNQSRSHQGIIRGLHYQIEHPQGKLVRVVAGMTYNVAVDLRRHSPTFGQWTGLTLSPENKNQLWVPPGFAHGFYSLVGPADLVYLVTDTYLPQAERSLIWNDPDLSIRWPFPPGVSPILSPKDAQGKLFKEAEIYEDL
jgi:dTDP-4-dehydrorhamnose 3,5-epimerase